ncbi:hypothetical protein ACFWIB_42465 [Streptomyces sp. NPDC127051]|uniref:hypothetical protein n=1 Tax=Streptomyces sp. NPDC127051 TaxID=3347119 RepID=UPI00365D33C2
MAAVFSRIVRAAVVGAVALGEGPAEKHISGIRSPQGRSQAGSAACQEHEDAVDGP